MTRSRSQVGEFSRLLRHAGADVVEIPAIEIVPRPNRELDPCISRAHRFDWLFFTSVNGAEIFLSRARELDSAVARERRHVPPESAPSDRPRPGEWNNSAGRFTWCRSVTRQRGCWRRFWNVTRTGSKV